MSMSSDLSGETFPDVSSSSASSSDSEEEVVFSIPPKKKTHHKERHDEEAVAPAKKPTQKKGSTKEKKNFKPEEITNMIQFSQFLKAKQLQAERSVKEAARAAKKSSKKAPEEAATQRRPTKGSKKSVGKNEKDKVVGRTKSARNEGARFDGEDVDGYREHLLPMAKSYAPMKYGWPNRSHFGTRYTEYVAKEAYLEILTSAVRSNSYHAEDVVESQEMTDLIISSLHDHVPSKFHRLLRKYPPFGKNFLRQVSGQRSQDVGKAKTHWLTLLLQSGYITNPLDPQQFKDLLSFRSTSDEAAKIVHDNVPPFCFDDPAHGSVDGLLLSPPLVKLARCFLNGPASIRISAEGPKKPQASTLADLWKIDQISIAYMAYVINIADFETYCAASGTREPFTPRGSKSGINWQHRYNVIRYTLERFAAQNKLLFENAVRYWNSEVFGGNKKSGGVATVTSRDAEEDLDELFGAISLRGREYPHSAPVERSNAHLVTFEGFQPSLSSPMVPKAKAPSKTKRKRSSALRLEL
ncbi:hypothetical protein FB45DRAFT_1032133 [Roridomyces roridus]|uniref:Uncharacterized protein n=1 Tax=Roridomyces roridus TaxID=1738132 RepID=A0AAD7BJ36_9AGAR|nr:hypothetical protein FB45DRAFT_1032133 [Roridomyces roridus]